MSLRSAVRADLFRACFALSLVSILAACGPAPESTTSTSSEAEVVARFGELEITVDEIDAHVLALPPSERPVPGADLDAWYRERIREMVVEARLRAEAEADDLVEDPVFVRARAEAEKQIGLQLCLAVLRPDLGDLGTEELQAAYEARVEQFTAPERRFVYHLFLRRPDGASIDSVRAEIEALRDRALRGEGFARLAEEHSDSEGRHQQGGLGWVTPGVLPEGFEKVIFDLPEGVPSEPVETRDGLHLFYVDQALPERTAGFDEVRRQLAQNLLAERRAAALTELAAEIEVPDGSLVLDREAFAEVIAAGDPEAVVLRIAETELDLGDLRQALGQQGNRGANARAASASTLPESIAWQALEGIRRREAIYQHCRATDQVDAGALAERLATWGEGAVLRFQRHRRLVELAERDEERLSLFYRSNIGDFSSRPRWHVRLMKVPLGSAPASTMTRLEGAASAPGTELDTLARELGGAVEDLGFVDLATLGRLAPKLPALVTPLAPGQLAAPFRFGDQLAMAEVVARQDAEPRPFDDVRARVAAAYVGRYTHDVYEELIDEILGAGPDLEIDPEALASLREAGLPQPEITVDELEELFEEL